MQGTAKSRAPEGSRIPPGWSGAAQGQNNTTTSTAASKSTTVDLPSITVPQITANVEGLAKRALDGQFRVNPANGTLSLTVPLWTTPGRSGMQPQLELAYDSGGGNGICGIGWQLGIAQVSRKTMKQLPRYDSSDVFVASGFDDLVQSQDPQSTFQVKGAYGGKTWNVVRYRPRVDVDASRIELWSEEADPENQFWRMVSPDNVTRIYGFTEAARIQGKVGGHLQTFTWLLETTYDGVGNAMQHCYIAGDGRPYLKSIRYGNRRPCRDLSTWKFQPVLADDWLYEVVLDYGEHSTATPTTQLTQPALWRADPFSSFSAGFGIRTTRLCRRILVFHHMPEVLHRQDYLVGSTTLVYNEKPDGTFLTEICRAGHTLCDNGDYETEEMPPLSFTYSERCNWDKVEVQAYDTSSLQGVPGRQCPQIQWLDLNGDGCPGLLYEMKLGAWFYQRNENVGRLDEEKDQMNDCSGFGAVQMLDTKPAGQGDHYFADLQGNGQLDAVSVNTDGRVEGFYPRRRDSGWDDFQPFLTIPQEFRNDTIGSPHFVKIDLTGNGLADLMWIDDFAGELVWHECRGLEGFGPATRVPVGTDGPTLYHEDAFSRIFYADMSGDGLTDIVLVRAGQVSYWPNLGYGQFGAQVIMENAPDLSQGGGYLVSERIHLADITGTGTADILYLPPEGGLYVYQNLSGNSWHEKPVYLPSFPAIDQMSSVLTVDLLGNGTNCLCWTGPGSGPTLDLHYIDATAGLKPGLLTSYSTGSGLLTSAKYRPSTWYALKDERRGRPWSEKLPFPVQCVDTIVQCDIPGGRSTTTRYIYHDGYYDGVEREFRGFAMVDEFEKTVFTLPGSGASEHRYSRTPIRRRQWYYTGSPHGLGAIQHMWSQPQIKQPHASMYASPMEQREMHRALKGKVAHQEVFEDDGSEKANLPYQVLDSTYNVVCVQKPVEERCIPGIYNVQPRETLESFYERNKTDPRQKHELTLTVNDFGDVVQSITIAYAPTAKSISHHTGNYYPDSIAVYKEIEYSNTVESGDYFYKPVPTVSREYRLYGLSPTSNFLDYETMRSKNYNMLQNVPQPFPDNKKSSSSGQSRSLTRESRQYYRSADLQQPLKLGKVEAPVVLHQSFQLAMTKEIMEAAYGSNTSVSVAQMNETLQVAGYVHLDKNVMQWWQPSSRSRFSLDGANELRIARQSFYQPTISIDPFGEASTISMDPWFLMPSTSTDAVGNVTRAINDYVHMAVKKVIDINGNCQEVAYDSLGRLIAKAYSGKPEELGDSLQTLPSCSSSQMEAFFEKPSESEAIKLLGSATERVIEDSHRFMRSQRQGVMEPTVRAVIRRLVHSDVSEAQQQKLEISLTWLNASGAPLQTANYTGQEWCFSGLEQHHGSTLMRKYHPFLHAQPIWQPAGDPAATTYFHDALNRKVATLNPDHTWSKAVIGAWAHSEFDEGDTFAVSDPTTDPDVGVAFKGLPSQLYIHSYEQYCLLNGRNQAASQSKEYGESPTIVYLDALGREIITVRDSQHLKQTESRIFDDWGNIERTVDALKRVVERVQYNPLGQPLYRHRMDSGEEWIVPDVVNNVVLQWNSRQIVNRITYDLLRRPLEKWTQLTPGGSEILNEQREYGEQPEHAGNSSLKNQRGQVVVVRGQFGVRFNEAYDFRGNLIQSSVQFAVEYATELNWQKSVPLEPGLHTSFTQYDIQARKVWSKNAAGNQTRHVYTPHGLLQSVLWRCDETQEEWQSFIANITYNAFHNRIVIDYGNKCRTENTYDQLSQRLVRKRTSRGRGSLLEDIQYEHDCLHRLIQEEDQSQSTTFFQNNRINAAKQFTYDGLGRLIQASGREQIDQRKGEGRGMKPYTACSGPVTQRSIPGTGDQLCRYVELYEYDLANNILTLAHRSFSNGSVSDWTRRYTYKDSNNRLLETSIGRAPEKYEYDGDAGHIGLMTSMPGFPIITWDHSNRMRSTTRQIVNSGNPETTWYVYDENGHRLRKVTQRADDGSAGGRKLRESLYLEDFTRYQTYTGDGQSLQSQKFTAHITGLDLVALIEKDNLTQQSKPLIRYQLSNNLEVSDDASIVSYEEHSPFGAVTYSACRKDIEAPSAYRYAAYERDPETSLDYCDARYYAWWIGRWIAPDPSGLVDGLNLFVYVGNDPINFVDPSGRMKGFKFPTMGQYVAANMQQKRQQMNPMQHVTSITQGMKQQHAQETYLRDANQGIQRMNQFRATYNEMGSQVSQITQNMLSMHQATTRSLLDNATSLMDTTTKSYLDTKASLSSSAHNATQHVKEIMNTPATEYEGVEYTVGDMTASGAAYVIDKAVGTWGPFIMLAPLSQGSWIVRLYGADILGKTFEHIMDKHWQKAFAYYDLKRVDVEGLAKKTIRDAVNGPSDQTTNEPKPGPQQNSTDRPFSS